MPLFLQANELDPHIPVVKNQLGNYVRGQGQWDSALGYYLAAVELEPEEPLYHFQAGHLLLNKREEILRNDVLEEEALDRQMLEHFHTAARLDPEENQYGYHLGLAFYAIAEPRWEDALAHWRRMEDRVAPGLEKEAVLLHQARVLWNLEDPGAARALLDRVSNPVLERNRRELAEKIRAAEEEK